ncbi:MAG: hypothetical protein AAGD10_10870 [Myxococcota bacterium]
MMRCARQSSLSIFALLLFATACGDSPGDLGPADAGTGENPEDMGVVGLPDASTDLGPDASMDMGMVMDAGTPDLGTPDMGRPDAGAFACDLPQVVTGVLNETIQVSFDTSATELRPRDLGLLCGNSDPATRWAPQQIIAYEVPGNGPVAVRFSTRNAGTSTNFDTVVQVRRGSCDAPPPLEDGRFPAPSCFEDATESLQAPDFRSEGAIQAAGGEILYFVVTGYSGGTVPQLDDQGAVTLDITPTSNEPPRLDDASPYIFGQDLFIRLNGDDPDGNVRGAILNFRIGGQVADIYGIGTADGNVSAIVFDQRPNEVRNYVGRPQVPFMLPSAPPPGVDGVFVLDAQVVGLNPTLSQFIQNAGIQQLGVRVFDDAFAISEERIVDVILNGRRADFGESCVSAICAEPFVCEADVCGPGAAAQMACDPMNVIDAGLSDTSSVSEVMVRIPFGAGAFGTPSCVAPGTAEAAEAVLAVEIPAAGRFDLLATTDNETTGTRDTIMYLRQNCVNPQSQLACNDDIEQGNDASAVEVLDILSGTYFLIVEPARRTPLTQSIDLGVDLRLRPVVGQGQACDPAELLSRCEVGSCQGAAGAETCTL